MRLLLKITRRMTLPPLAGRLAPWAIDHAAALKIRAKLVFRQSLTNGTLNKVLKRLQYPLEDMLCSGLNNFKPYRSTTKRYKALQAAN